MDEVFMTFVYQPLFDPDGSVSGILVHGVDVTAQVRAREQVEQQATELEELQAETETINEELQRANEELSEKTREAEEANRAKSEFLASMSHELRTPLNAIAGYLDLVSLGIHGPVTDAQHVALARIKRNQEVLLSLINDVINFAKLEAGRLEIECVEVPVGPLLEAMEPLIAPQVHARDLVYRCDACASELAALGDPERIQQVLINLLANAVKFSPAGADGSPSAPPAMTTWCTSASWTPAAASRPKSWIRSSTRSCRWIAVQVSLRTASRGWGWGWRSAASSPAPWPENSPPRARPR